MTLSSGPDTLERLLLSNGLDSIGLVRLQSVMQRFQWSLSCTWFSSVGVDLALSLCPLWATHRAGKSEIWGHEWAHEWPHKWVHEWAHESAHESAHETPTRAPMRVDFACSSPRKLPRNVPRRCPQKCPRKVFSQVVGVHLSCFHLFCSSTALPCQPSCIYNVVLRLL